MNKLRSFSFVFVSVLFITSCGIGPELNHVTSSVVKTIKAPFTKYNYKSNLKTYRPVSWRAPVKRYPTLPKSKRENWKNYKVGGPYKIAGEWYYPKEEPNYKEVGEASWYGAKFHNKQTANGEVFNRHSMTAAHRTLPLPSMVRVTNLENGRSVLVRVNDRGPFAKDRIIDMSERAAGELGFHKQGTARVRVELDRKATEDLFYDPWDVNEKASPKQEDPRHATSPSLKTVDERVVYFEEHFVQAGSYSTWDNARKVASGLREIAPASIQEGDYRGGIVYRVKLGPFQSEQKAGEVLDEVAMMGFGDAVILNE